MKNALLILLGLTVSATLILVSLDKLMGHPNLSRNGFNRKFVPLTMASVNTFELKHGYSDISGVKDNTVYLQSPKPGNVAVFNLSDNTTSAEKINLPAIDKLEPAFSTSVRYPEIYITATNARKFIRGNLKTGHVAIFDIPMGPVLDVEVFDTNHAIVRCVDTTTFDLKFHRIDLNTNRISKSANVSEVQVANMFAYDGKLTYDNEAKKFWYVNYYCNGITWFDSTLAINRMKSIDTVSVPRVPVENFSGSITQKAPPVTVNKTSFVYGGRLYVQSALKADNEKQTAEGAVIDVYDRKYIGSFYIPVTSHEFVDAEFIDRNRLAVLSKDRLLIYRLDNVLK